MKPVLRVLAVAALTLVFALPATAEKATSRTFAGTYDWKQGGVDTLSAEFTSSGEGNWDIEFKFHWNGENHTWKGTAEGSLEDGSEFAGTAASGSRRWVFEATIRDGVMRGKHTELKGENRLETGTFELKP